MEGNYILYYDNGSIKTTGSYLNDIKNGLWTEYYGSGNIKSTIDFIDGNGFYNDVYGVKTSALEKVCDVKDTDDTEYIRLYFTETNLFDVRKIDNIPEKYLKN